MAGGVVVAVLQLLDNRTQRRALPLRVLAGARAQAHVHGTEAAATRLVSFCDQPSAGPICLEACTAKLAPLLLRTAVAAETVPGARGQLLDARAKPSQARLSRSILA